MKLRDILLQITEDSTVHALHGGNPNVMEFPKENFAVSLFPNEKRLEVSPRDDSQDVRRIRSLILNLRHKFKIDNVVQLDMNAFDVRFSASENFDRVRSYIETHAA